MHHIVNTPELVSQGVLTEAQGRIIADRSRAAMMALAINTVLCAGIVAAALGFVFWLADAFAVAVVGGIFLAIGAAILQRGGAVYGMFGNAAALIGAGMLASGAAIELIDKLPKTTAGVVLLLAGAVLVLLSFGALRYGAVALRFVAGSVLLMGVALHLGGILLALEGIGASGGILSAMWLYAAGVIVLAGVAVDVRLVTALAIVPFAQVLNTSTSYWNAVYAFYSPEPTLSILQMAALIAACLWAAARFGGRGAAHGGMLAIMGFVVLNLCFLVGSLFGDAVGESWWRVAQYTSFTDGQYDWEAYEAARLAYRAQTLYISEHVFSAIWAALLIAVGVWAARTWRRGLFNAAMVFGAIHSYTQAFESFGDEPLAYVIGGLGAIPLAWGIWRLNQRFMVEN